MAVDPGGTTGIALRLPNGRISTYAIQTQEDLWEYFLPEAPRLDQVVLEEWHYFDGIARPAGVHTAGLVASLRGICYVQNITLALRTPSSRLGKPMRDATEWYRQQNHISAKKALVKFQSHEIDALAHLFAWEHLQHG